jgi:N-acetylneuraminate synthase
MEPKRVCVIAEAGVNHNGELDLARRLVDVAVDAGADVVKFQTFTAEALVQRNAPKAEYQKVTTGTTESQYEMLRKLELSEDFHRTLAAQSRSRGIEFLSTPFDESAVDLLERIGVARFKLSSGEVTNLLLLQHVASKNKPVILSTGMATMQEIGAAMNALRDAGAKDVSLLHCVSDYPTKPEDVNLRVMETIRSRFKVAVGLSDHTQGISVVLAAVALGAEFVEKHVTLDRNLPGPDHRASLEPSEFRAMVRGIREVEAALGTGEKKLTVGEASTLQVARRSLVAASNLPAGTILERRHLAAKRPGTGISPMDAGSVVGKRLKRATVKDAMIAWDDLA